PTLTLISPTGGPPGLPVAVTLRGTDFTSGMTASAGSGITTSLTVLTTTLALGTFTVSPSAVLGDRNVTVTTPGGTSNPRIFSVTPFNAPTISSIRPNSATAGSTVEVSLTGTNFVPGMTVSAGAG